jgi:hypothetical protein
MEALPPPDGLTDRDANWEEAERELGLTFPNYFKEYIAAYGGSNWFDLYCVLYPDAHAKNGWYVEKVRFLLKMLAEVGITDDGCTLFPEKDGLFPFMDSTDGDYYFWKTSSEDPDMWPLMVWQTPGLFPLKSSTIAEIFLDTLEEFKVSQPHRVWVRARGRE